MDNKELVAGTTLFLPVHAKGALFEIGDGHAGQGNGEVDITALETSLVGTLQFIVHKGTGQKYPRAETPTHYISMGFHPELYEATRMAVREMIDFLVSEQAPEPRRRLHADQRRRRRGHHRTGGRQQGRPCDDAEIYFRKVV